MGEARIINLILVTEDDGSQKLYQTDGRLVVELKSLRQNRDTTPGETQVNADNEKKI